MAGRKFSLSCSERQKVVRYDMYRFMNSLTGNLSAHSAVTRRLLALMFLGVIAVSSSASAQAFFLPTGADVHNTGKPRMATDSRGGLHVVSPMVAELGAVYAYCPWACDEPTDVASVDFTTEEYGAVSNAVITVGEDDAVHLLLATYDAVIYAVCVTNCGQANQWESAVIHQHDDDWEMTGNAFALDLYGRPRFLMHAYQAYLGMFAPDPGTRFFACDADCLNPASWQSALISEQSWLESTLLYDAANTAHVATVIPVEDADLVAYLSCAADCLNENVDNWPGLGLAEAYSDRYISEIAPAVSMALTSTGGVRMAFLGSDEGEPFLAYFECEFGCANGDGDDWSGMILLHSTDGSDFGDGIALTLDKEDNPRLAYTVSSSILLAHCSNDCAGDAGEDDWGLATVELASDIPPDDIFLYHNCTVGMWFLRQPAVVIGPTGLPAVAYRAEDISAGWTSPDPTKPSCPAGVDMTMNRLVVLDSY